MSRVIAVAASALLLTPALSWGGPYGLFDTTGEPATVAAEDEAELGVRFEVAEPASVVGVRVFRADHRPVAVSLWDAYGEQLAGPAPLPAGAGAWRDALFDVPVEITPGETYIASYHVTGGEHAAERLGLLAPLSRGLLTAPASTPDQGNGVHCYGPAPCFPSDSSEDTNYWVTPLVADATAPVLTAHDAVTVNATSANGAVVGFTVPTAADDVDGALPVACAPPTGSHFAPGTTRVTCSATDSSGNTGTSAFDVLVRFAMTGFGLTGRKDVRAGSTVPIRWRVTNGGDGAIGNVGIVRSVTAAPMSCGAALRWVQRGAYKASKKKKRPKARAAAAAGVRFDARAAQFVFQWRSPRQPGVCYRVDVTLTDGLTRTATFALR